MFFVIPATSFASISINEVMYDLEGTDSDREWIELMNAGAESVNLSNWKFFENNSNHGLSLYSGNESIGPGEFVVIADSPETFLSDWPSFSGNMFDSSWSSFSNTGETFSIKNEDGDIVDEFTYTPEDGANGDGKSLQLIEGSFLPASPTPGSANQISGEVLESLEEVQIPENSSSESPEKNIIKQSTFGIPQRAVVGERIDFEPEIYDDKGELIFKANLNWSLGDGASREDEYRKNFSHTYNYPGTYVVYLEVYTTSQRREPEHVYRQTISVVPASVRLTLVDGGVAVKNKSVYELDIGGWNFLFDKNSIFRIPQNTIILPGKEIVFSESILSESSIVEVSLINEVGSVVASFGKKVESLPVVNVKQKVTHIPIPITTTPAVKISKDQDKDSDLKLDESLQVASANRALPDNTKNNNSLWFWVYGVLIAGVIGGVSFIYFRNEDEFINEVNDVDEYRFEE